MMASVCKVLSIALIAFFTVLFATYILIARLLVRGYYSSSHCAIFTCFAGIYVLLHYFCPPRFTGSLRVHTWYTIHAVGCGFFAFCAVAATVGYSFLVTNTVHINFDFAIAAGVSGFAAIILIGLFIERIRSAKLSDEDAIADGMILMKDFDNPDEVKYSPRLEDDDPPGCSWCSIFLVTVYFIFHLVLVLIYASSAYYPFAVTFDMRLYLNRSTDMYTVGFESHYRTAFFWQCHGPDAGDSVSTVVLEHGLGGFGSAAIPYLVHHLVVDGHRVCTYSRHGYGFSEGLEYDNVMFFNEPQYSQTNVEYFTLLVRETNVDANGKFFYVGHSYGGHHVAYAASKFPNMFAGLAFIDSAEFNATLPRDEALFLSQPPDRSSSSLYDLFSTLVHIQPTGALHLAIDLGLIDPRKFDHLRFNFTGVSDEDLGLIVAELRSGSVFAATLREFDYISTKSALAVSRTLSKDRIELPSLLIQRAGNPANWFPRSAFPETEEKVVANSTHFSLVYDMEHSWETAQYISKFIKKVLNN